MICWRAKSAMWPVLKTKRAPRGFTLLELLVALAVFALISLLAYRGLDAMSRTQARLDQEMRNWRELELVFERVALDVTQIAPRAWRDDNDTSHAAIEGQSTEAGPQCLLDLLRFGPDRNILHVRYRAQDGHLRMAVWPHDEPTSKPSEQVPYALLEQVESCELGFLNQNNQWVLRWPEDAKAPATRPRGLRVRLGLGARGVFERVYYLP